MSTGEGPPEDASRFFPDLKWDVPEEIRPNDPLLLRLYDNFNTVWLAKNNTELTHGTEGSELYLSTEPDANSLGVSISGRSRVPVGYFWGGKFVLYEERLDPSEQGVVTEEVERILFSAQEAEKQFIDNFDMNVSSDTRLDFRDPRIQEMHAVQHEYLSGDILNSLLRWRNKSIKDYPYLYPHLYPLQKEIPQPIYADKSTRAAVRFLPVLGKDVDYNEHTIAKAVVKGYVLAASVVGAYERISTPNNALKLRHPREDIVAAETDSTSLDDLSADDFNIIGHMITNEELESMVKLARQVEDLADEFASEGCEFDKKALGAKTQSWAWLNLQQLFESLDS